MRNEGAPAAVGLRPEKTDDMAFLQGLYASAREREMAQLPFWTDQQKRDFLEAQCNAQHSYYLQHYPNASFNIIERDGQAIGRLYVADCAREIVLMDITLLPATRNSGLGAQLVKQVQEMGRAQGKIVSLHVEDENPARRLYDRLGFEEVAEVTFYKRMHWVPEGLQGISDELAREVIARI
jgi:ribosomal protein S18 acetylase RimI-like enzyme